MRATTKDKDEKEAGFAIWDCGSPLYDSHELVSLTHLIERHMMSLPSLGSSKPAIAQFSHQEETMGSEGNAKGPFMAASFFEFLVRGIWKKKLIKESKENGYKRRKTGFSGFCKRISVWRK